MTRIGTDYIDDGKGNFTVTHFVDDLKETHDGAEPCPVCIAEQNLRYAEEEFGTALKDWHEKRRQS